MHIEDGTENNITEEEILVPGDPESAQKTLKELLLGIVLYGFLLQMIPIWFLTDKVAYSLALWIGIVTAICMALHMYRTLERALSYTDGAQKTVVVNSLLRYAMAMVVLLIVQYRGIGSPIVTFLGIMGLKAGAYLQPFVHKIVIFFNAKAMEKNDK